MEKYRKKLDIIDESMRQLFVERMETVKKIAMYKKDNNIRVEDRKREKDIFEKLVLDDPQLKDLYARFLSEVIAISKVYQELIIKEAS
jgi:chorismate mutase/prephenate dehydratase